MKHPPENQSQEVLAGLVERVTYHNVENGFWVLRAKVRVQIDPAGRQDHHHSTANYILAAPLCFALGADISARTGEQRLARELPTKRRPAEISVHPLAALMPSAGTNLI